MPIDNDRVIAIAKASAIASYSWRNRGQAPTGYIQGIAITYGEACEDLAAGDEVVAAIAAPLLGDDAHDALDWYDAILGDAGLSLDNANARLTAVFAILLGLGMRESSGKHCEGRDISAANVTAETAEAGLFQVSHNSIRAHPLLEPLFAHYQGRDDLLSVFDDGVHCSASSWKDWGEGPGVEFQALTKSCPKFAVLYAALLLRHQRKHWGPINRKEAEVTADTAALLSAVRASL